MMTEIKDSLIIC